MNVNVIWHLLSACELICILLCKEKTAVIMLKTLCGFVQNVLEKVARVCIPFVCWFVIIENRKKQFLSCYSELVFFLWKESVLKSLSVSERCVSVSLLGD